MKFVILFALFMNIFQINGQCDPMCQDYDGGKSLPISEAFKSFASKGEF